MAGRAGSRLCIKQDARATCYKRTAGTANQPCRIARPKQYVGRHPCIRKAATPQANSLVYFGCFRCRLRLTRRHILRHPFRRQHNVLLPHTPLVGWVGQHHAAASRAEPPAATTAAAAAAALHGSTRRSKASRRPLRSGRRRNAACGWCRRRRWLPAARCGCLQLHRRCLLHQHARRVDGCSSVWVPHDDHGCWRSTHRQDGRPRVWVVHDGCWRHWRHGRYCSRVGRCRRRRLPHDWRRWNHLLQGGLLPLRPH